MTNGAIREFEADGDCDYVDGNMVWKWHSKKSVNPRFIAAVAPFTEGVATITLAGSYAFHVNAPYDDVVAWWLESINA